MRPAGVDGDDKVFGLSQIARRVKVSAKSAGLADWELFSGHGGHMGMVLRMAQNGHPPTRSNARAAAWSAAIPAASPLDRRYGTYSSAKPGRSTNLFTCNCSATVFDVKRK